MSYFAKGQLLGVCTVFPKGDGADTVFEDTVIVDVTDTDEGQVEIAFTIKNPERRVYVCMKQSELRRAIREKGV